MTEYPKKSGHECPPPPDDPAGQPKPPGYKCDPLPTSTPPVLDPPAPCPDPCCKCPTPPVSNPNCLEDLIAKQTADALIAANAGNLKKELEDLLGAAKKAAASYTREKYEQLVAEWLKQDALIAELIRKLVCAVPCWRCIIDCYICPLLNDLHYAEKWLYDDGKVYTDVHNLYDLQHWCKQDLGTKQRRFNRIDSVLKVWLSANGASPKDPVSIIEKALLANKALIEATNKIIGTEGGKAIYDVFLKLVPLHLAIAPPAGPDTTTRIDEKFTKFCDCDKGTPDDCCGPDVGEWSLRQRLVGPQPYLIDPNKYFPLICCLVENRYLPAKDALSKADTELTTVTNKIARYEKQLAEGLNPDNFEKSAKGVIPSVIDCCDYEKDDEPASSR
jgi:hypothetical protein